MQSSGSRDRWGSSIGPHGLCPGCAQALLCMLPAFTSLEGLLLMVQPMAFASGRPVPIQQQGRHEIIREIHPLLRERPPTDFRNMRPQLAGPSRARHKLVIAVVPRGLQPGRRPSRTARKGYRAGQRAGGRDANDGAGATPTEATRQRPRVRVQSFGARVRCSRCPSGPWFPTFFTNRNLA